MLFIFCLMMTPAMVMSMEDEEFEYLEPLPDYYAMLNVSHDASMKQIKRSFRKLAMEYHPDKNKTEGTQIVFQELSEAYSILSDPLKKIEYDQLFQDFFDLAEAFEASGSNEPFNTADSSDADVTDAEVSNDNQDYVGEPGNEDQDVFEETNSHDKGGQKDYQHSPEHTSETYDSSEEIPEEVPENNSEEAPEQTSEKDSEGGEDEDSEHDLDDETLYKVLKFLADNDYVITKRTRKTPVNRGQNFRDESGQQRGYDNNAGYRSYAEFRGTSPPQFGNSRGYTGTPRGHQGHHHPWTASHQHKPRTGERPAHYSTQFHGSEQVYCKVSTSWEGQVKVTTRTCY